MKLKSIFGLAALLLATLGTTTACTDNKNEHHESFFYPNTPEGRVLYADQTTDTLHYVSLDSWRLNESFSSQSWFTASPKEFKIPANTMVKAPIIITTTPNTTGEVRSGRIEVTTTFEKFGTMAMLVRQTGWLNVQSPAPIWAAEAKKPSFTTTLTAEFAKARVVFYLYDTDKTKHHLTSDADWFVIPEANAQPAAGLTDLTIDIPNNTSTVARTATLTLTVGDITETLVFKQAGKEVKQ